MLYNPYIMKKLGLLLIAIVLVLGMTFGLSACNNATTEGQLENIFFDYQGTGKEIYTYDVENSSNGATGEYTIKIETKEKGLSVTICDDLSIPECVAGYLVTDELTMNDGYTSKATCFFAIAQVSGTTSSFLKPMASSKKVTGSENDFYSYGSYEGKKYYYTLTANGATKEGSIEVGTSKVYDNSEFHQVLRGIKDSIFEGGFTFAMTVPIVTATEETAVSISANSSSSTTSIETNVKDINGNKVSKDCYTVRLSRSTKVEGITQSFWYTKDPVKIDGFSLKHVLFKIEEASVTYTLKSYAIEI